MPRQSRFDEAAVVRDATALFAERGYEGCSVDDLVSHLGVHRSGLYRAFGSKLGLFRRVLATQVDDVLLPWIGGLAAGPSGPLAAGAVRGPAGVALLLVALVEPVRTDAIVSGEVVRVLDALGLATAGATAGGPSSDEGGAGTGTSRGPAAAAPRGAVLAAVLGFQLLAHAGAAGRA